MKGSDKKCEAVLFRVCGGGGGGGRWFGFLLYILSLFSLLFFRNLAMYTVKITNQKGFPQLNLREQYLHRKIKGVMVTLKKCKFLQLCEHQ